jgi:hypothetical protein
MQYINLFISSPLRFYSLGSHFFIPTHPVDTMMVKILNLLAFIGWVAAESCTMRLNVGGVACEAYKPVACSELPNVQKNLQDSFHAAPVCSTGRSGISCDIKMSSSKAEIRNWFTTHKWGIKCCLKAGEAHCP